MERRKSEPHATVELGVGNGNYARWLVETGNKNVWAYDTFDGAFPLHTVSDWENRDTYAIGGQSSNTTVRSLLESLGVTCVTGVFPDTFHEAHPYSVEFVHADMDTYVAIKAALELFHPLMIEGGVFMVHDYNNVTMPGARKATEEFIETHGEEYDCMEDSDHYRLRKKPSPKS